MQKEKKAQAAQEQTNAAPSNPGPTSAAAALRKKATMHSVQTTKNPGGIGGKKSGGFFGNAASATE